MTSLGFHCLAGARPGVTVEVGGGDLSLPFRGRGRRHPDCPSGKGFWRPVGRDCRAPACLAPAADSGPALREPIVGAGRTYMVWPPAEFFRNWLCRLHPDFQQRPRWSLRVKMLPLPHLPGQRVLISHQVPRMKPQSAWQPLLWVQGEGARRCGSLSSHRDPSL